MLSKFGMNAKHNKDAYFLLYSKVTSKVHEGTYLNF